MKTFMERKYKAVSVVWAALGIIFLAGALLMLIMRDDMPQIPRADIAYIGFLIIGIIFLIVTAATYCMAKDKNAMIGENDERSDIISGKAGNLAFLIQTVLLSSALFLLCFIGYANAPVIITLMCIIALSVFIYIISSLYYNQKM